MSKYFRVYTGDDGLSHIEESDLPFEAFLDTEGAWGDGTPMENAAGVTFRRNAPGYFLDWHCAPRRQYSIMLAGEAEIASSDGTVVRCGRGSILLAEDLTGKGHTTRVVGDQERLTVLIPLAD